MPLPSLSRARRRLVFCFLRCLGGGHIDVYQVGACSSIERIIRLSIGPGLAGVGIIWLLTYMPTSDVALGKLVAEHASVGSRLMW